MQMDDMILVSIDDHMVEPPDMYKNHVPDEVAGQRCPRSSATTRASTSGCSRGSPRRRRSAWPPPSAGPREEWGFNPGAFSELRPGCFDVHERVRDMNANGVLASMNFPTMAGFNARTFNEAPRQGDLPRHAAGLQRLGHRRVVRRLPGPVHPPRHRADVGRRPRRRGGPPARQEGLPVDQLPRGPARPGLPELPVRPLGPDAQGHVRREHGALAPHRRRVRPHQEGARGAHRPPDRADLPDLRADRPGPAVRARRCAGSPTSRWRCRRAASAGSPSTSTGPTATSRTRRGCTTTLRRQAPVRRVPRPHAGLLHHRSVGLWPCATASASTSSPGSATTPTPTRRGPSRPSSRGRSSRRPAAPTRRSTRSPGRTPAGSSTGTPSPTRPKDQATVGALRSLAKDVDTTRMPRTEWRKRNEAAGIGVF